VRAQWIWVLLFVLTAIFLVLYLFSAHQPAQIITEALTYFTREQIMLGREYARQQQLAFVLGFVARLFALIIFAFGPGAVALEQHVERMVPRHSTRAALFFFFLLWLLLQMVNLPFSFYRSHVLDHRWGFSTQSFFGWWLDYGKGAVLDLAFSALTVILFFHLLQRWSKNWWVPASLFMTAWLLIQVFFWPTLIAPLYNRFQPVEDPEVIAMVRDLASRAEIPITEILVMDASRRTTKANAYFAGLGTSKRIVLYDTLLHNFRLAQIKAVVAHEMAHWKLGHIRTGVLLGSLATSVQLYVLSLLLGSSGVRYGLVPYPLRTWAVALLAMMLISFVASPAQTAVSRQMEQAADAMAVRLTEDPEGAVALQQDLAKTNRSDITPPAFIEWFAHTHHSPWRRIKLIETRMAK
jgi:STE24 endopeptidase